MTESTPPTFASVAAKPGIKSTELWLVLVTGAAITEISNLAGGPTWQQVTCCLSLALMVGAYSIGRSIAKRS